MTNDDLISCSNFNIVDKDQRIKDYIGYMLNRTRRIFKYKNIEKYPTLRVRDIELMLQTQGHISCSEFEGKLYAFRSGLGGQLDEYYFPTKSIVSNPFLHYTAELDIGKDCVIVKNDSLLKGLLPLYYRYASLMCENDITMRLIDINMRIADYLTADNDTAKKSADDFIRKINKGEIATIGSKAFFEGIKAIPTSMNSGSSRLTDTIEYQQYLKAGWFNELGLNANYNMKRESINSTEAELNDDALLTLVNDMLECRKEGFAEVNKMYGTDIEVEYSDIWKAREEEVKDEIKKDKDGEDDETDTSV